LFREYSFPERKDGIHDKEFAVTGHCFRALSSSRWARYRPNRGTEDALYDVASGARRLHEASASKLDSALTAFVLETFHPMPDHLFQTDGLRPVSSPIILIDLLAITHHRPGKTRSASIRSARIASVQRIAEHPFDGLGPQHLKNNVCSIAVRRSSCSGASSPAKPPRLAMPFR
jgi:hypothetical protein